MKNPRFHEIDLLRFLAALAVLIFHYTYRGTILGLVGGRGLSPYRERHEIWLPGRQPVLPHQRVRDPGVQRGQVAAAVRNLADRQRLYPTYWCCLTVTFLAILLFGRGMFHAGAGQYLANLTMLHSFAGIEAIDGVYWSLAVEMKFYLLVFLLVALGQMGRVKYCLGIWLALAIGLLNHHLPLVSGLLIAQYAGCFIAGATFYLIAKEGNSFYKTVLLLGSFYAVQARAVQATAEAVEELLAPGSPLVIVLVLGGFFLLMYLIAVGKTARFGLKKFAGLGALTYPLYLLHQNLGYLRIRKARRAREKHVLLVGVTGLMIAAACLVHRSIECRYGPRLRKFLDRFCGSETRPGTRLSPMPDQIFLFPFPRQVAVGRPCDAGISATCPLAASDRHIGQSP